MPPPRKSDIGGEVTSSTLGANVKLLWREEELERVHFLLLQVPWSFVGRLRDEAEKNEHGGQMFVDLSLLRQDGVPLFNDDFLALFREVFVRRFIPCQLEKFNKNDTSKPLSKLPDDVGDSVRLLVLCERLKAALKQDVKDHLDRLIARNTKANRPAESVAFKIVQASLEIDSTVPPRGSLQERVVQNAMEQLATQLPESLDALQELAHLACELQRSEMCMRLFRVTAEKALVMAGKLPGEGKEDAVHQSSSASISQDKMETSGSDSKKIEAERQRLTHLLREIEQQRRELREETYRLEQLRAAAGPPAVGTLYASKKHFEPVENEEVSENSFNNGNASSDALLAKHQAIDGALALRQGVILEKIGSNTGDRIVRVIGDALEWRKGNQRFTKEHTVLRHEVVSIKIVDPMGKTFLLSTKTRMLTLRTLSDQSTQLFVRALESWVKGAAKLKRAPIAPGMSMTQGAATPGNMSMAFAPSQMPAPSAVTSRRFPRISMSFRRNNPSESHQLTVHRGAESSFVSNDGSLLVDED